MRNLLHELHNHYLVTMPERFDIKQVIGDLIIDDLVHPQKRDTLSIQHSRTRFSLSFLASLPLNTNRVDLAYDSTMLLSDLAGSSLGEWLAEHPGTYSTLVAMLGRRRQEAAVQELYDLGMALQDDELTEMLSTLAHKLGSPLFSEPSRNSDRRREQLLSWGVKEVQLPAMVPGAGPLIGARMSELVASGVEPRRVMSAATMGLGFTGVMAVLDLLTEFPDAPVEWVLALTGSGG